MKGNTVEYVGQAAGIQVPDTVSRVDLQGRWLVPVSSVTAACELCGMQATVLTLARLQGLHDPHVHLIQGGLSLAQLQLASVTSKQAFVDAVAGACGAHTAQHRVHPAAGCSSQHAGQCHQLQGKTALSCCAERAPKGSWVRGHGWADDLWGSTPHRSWLDPVCSDNPVFLTRRDNHMAIISSAAGVWL